MEQEAEIQKPWYKRPIALKSGEVLLTAFLAALVTGAFAEWQNSREAKLRVSTLGYRCNANIYFPLLGFKIGEANAVFYWATIRNDGKKPLHQIRVIIENTGDIQTIQSSKGLSMKTMDGSPIEDLSSFSGASAIKFVIDSLPPDGEVTLFYCAYAPTGLPIIRAVSEETLGVVRVNHSSLTADADAFFDAQNKQFRESFHDMKRWGP
jgi:hypothetical protein